MMSIVLVLLIEFLIVIVFFLVSTWTLRKVCNLLTRVSLFRGKDTKIKVIRRNINGLLFFTCLLLILGIIGVNGFLIYQGKNPKEYTITLINQIPSGFWLRLGFGIAQCAGVVFAAGFVIKLLNYWLQIAAKKVKNLEQKPVNDENIDAFFTTLNRRITLGICLWILIVCSQFLQLPPVLTQYLYIGLTIYLIIATGLLILKTVGVIVDTLDALSIRYSSPDNLFRFYDRLGHLVPFLKSSLEFVVYVSTATLVVQQVQLIPQA